MVHRRRRERRLRTRRPPREHGQVPFTHGPVGQVPSGAHTGRSAQLPVPATGFPAIASKTWPYTRTTSPTRGRGGWTGTSPTPPAPLGPGAIAPGKASAERG